MPNDIGYFKKKTVSDKQKQLNYWKSSAEDDLEAADVLFDGGKYLQALFFSHLVIEKMLKAL